MYIVTNFIILKSFLLTFYHVFIAIMLFVINVADRRGEGGGERVLLLLTF